MEDIKLKQESREVEWPSVRLSDIECLASQLQHTELCYRKKRYIQHQHFELLGLIWTLHSPRETQDYAKITRLFCMEYLPQIFNSADQTNSYHSDDSVACGETFSWINAQVHVKHWNSLRFWIDETFCTTNLKRIKKDWKRKQILYYKNQFK